MVVAVHGRPPRRQAVAGHPSVHQRALGALEGAKPFLSGQQAQQLGAWFTEGALKLAPEWKMRGRTGHVRECHGDLHLDNVVDLDGRATAFDAIDFDPALRWIDVVEDAAFPAMDFAARGRSDYC